MVILFVLVGTFIGAMAAWLALWTGGSILFALACYSLFGTLGAMAVVVAAYLRSTSGDNTADWTESQTPEHPLSV